MMQDKMSPQRKSKPFSQAAPPYWIGGTSLSGKPKRVRPLFWFSRQGLVSARRSHFAVGYFRARWIQLVYPGEGLLPPKCW